jgi:hypothetical protein
LTANSPLSARDLISYTLRSIFGNFSTLVGLCAPALLVLVAAGVAARILFPVDPEGQITAALPMLATATLIANIALIPAFTGWHRLLILGDARRDNGRAFGWDRREWRYLGYLLGIWAMMLVVNIAVGLLGQMLAGAGAVGSGLILVIALTGYLAIWSNIGMALPAAAMNDKRRMGEVVAFVKGYASSIAFGLAGIWLILGVIGSLLVFAATAMGAAIGSVYLVFIAIMLFYYVGLVASVGVLSRAYSVLSQQQS